MNKISVKSFIYLIKNPQKNLIVISDDPNVKKEIFDLAYGFCEEINVNYDVIQRAIHILDSKGIEEKLCGVRADDIYIDSRYKIPTETLECVVYPMWIVTGKHHS